MTISTISTNPFSAETLGLECTFPYPNHNHLLSASSLQPNSFSFPFFLLNNDFFPIIRTLDCKITFLPSPQILGSLVAIRDINSRREDEGGACPWMFLGRRGERGNSSVSATHSRSSLPARPGCELPGGISILSLFSIFCSPTLGVLELRFRRMAVPSGRLFRSGSGTRRGC